MESWESRWDEVKSEERRCSSAKVRRKKIHPRQMLEKSRNAVFFQWFVCRVSQKVGLLKRRVRSHVVRGEIKNCTPLWRKAHLEVKMYKEPQLRSTFWSYDVEKLHAAVAKSTFGSENVQNRFEALFELWCRKLARAHLWVKMYKTRHVRSTFWSSDVKKWHAAVARSTFASENVKKLRVRSGSTFWRSDVEKLHAAVARSAFSSEIVQNTSAADSFLKFWCLKIARRCGVKHVCKSKCAKSLCFGTLFEVQMSKN